MSNETEGKKIFVVVPVYGVSDLPWGEVRCMISKSFFKLLQKEESWILQEKECCIIGTKYFIFRYQGTIEGLKDGIWYEIRKDGFTECMEKDVLKKMINTFPSTNCVMLEDTGCEMVLYLPSESTNKVHVFAGIAGENTLVNSEYLKHILDTIPECQIYQEDPNKPLYFLDEEWKLHAVLCPVRANMAKWAVKKKEMSDLISKQDSIDDIGKDVERQEE